MLERKNNVIVIGSFHYGQFGKWVILRGICKTGHFVGAFAKQGSFKKYHGGVSHYGLDLGAFLILESFPLGHLVFRND